MRPLVTLLPSETSGLVDNDELQYDEQEMEVEPYTPYISSTENPVSPSKRDSVRYSDRF